MARENVKEGRGHDPNSEGGIGSRPNEIDFEQALKELEDIVAQLEGGNLALEKSLSLFERGVALARQCKTRLDAAQLRVAKLVKDKEGLFAEDPFEDKE